MNQYGQMAETFLRERDPQRYERIPDKETFFTAWGEQAAQQIQIRTQQRDPQPETEDYLETVGRLKTGRASAESDVMAEMLDELIAQI